MDTKPLAGSMNPITSDAVFTALEGKVGTEGGVMTGPLELPGEPEEENQAATKGYVDEHSGGGDGASKALDNLELPLEWKSAGTPEYLLENGMYWDVGKVYIGVNSQEGIVMTSTDGEHWEYLTPVWFDWGFDPTYWMTSAKDMLCFGAMGVSGAYVFITFDNTIDAALSDENSIFIPNNREAGLDSVDSLYSAYFDGVYYVAVNETVYASSDKETFSEVTLPSLNEVYVLVGMAANDSALVLLFADESENEERMPRKAVYTTDGTTWNTYDFTGCTDWADIVTDGTIIVSVPLKFPDSPDNETAFYTEDGVNWTSASFDYENAIVTCDGARFIAWNFDGNTGMVSYDGKSWESITFPVENVDSLVGGGGRFILRYMVEGDSEEWYAEGLVSVAPEKTYKHLLPVLNMVTGANGSGGSGISSNLVIDDGQSTGEIAEALKAIINNTGAPILLASGYLSNIIQYNLGGYEVDGNNGIVEITMVGIEKGGRIDSPEYAYIETMLFTYANELWSKYHGHWQVAATQLP